MSAYLPTKNHSGVALWAALAGRWRLGSRVRAPVFRPVGQPACLSLDKGALLWVARPFGYRFECVSGSIWITQDSDPKDTVLAAGESYTADRPARMLVQALEAAVLRTTGDFVNVTVPACSAPRPGAFTSMQRTPI